MSIGNETAQTLLKRKHRFMFLPLIFLAVSMAFGQGSWVKQSLLPTSDDLYDVAYVTPNHGFIFGIAHGKGYGFLRRQ